MKARRLSFALLAASAVSLCAPALADSIYLYNNGSPMMTPFRENVTILRITNQAMVFRTASGSEQEIALEKVARISVSADPALSAADDAFVLGQHEKAVDAYLKAIRSSEAWKIRWVTPRLLQAATKANRFDAALSAFLSAARIDPPSAVANKPPLPPKGSKLLDEAVKQIEPALRTAANNPEKQALLSLLLDIQIQRGDSSATEAIATQLSAIEGGEADPRLANMLVGIRFDQASAELAAKRYHRVAEILAPVRSKLSSPAQQARAMYLLAQAQQGLAGNDAAKQLDTAIDYMRIVAQFGVAEGRPFVAESLLEAAKINHAIGDAAAAKLLFQQVQDEFAGTSSASEAARLQNELSK